jgi:hypothetical protein
MGDQPLPSRGCRGVLAARKSDVVTDCVRKRIDTVGGVCRIGIGINADI